MLHANTVTLIFETLSFRHTIINLDCHAYQTVSTQYDLLRRF